MSNESTQVLIIRHGEKPGDAATESASDGTVLSLKGSERAAALAPYVPGTFPSPNFLFATKASKHSNRPVLSITPLADALKLTINDKHSDDDFQKVADDVRGDAKYAGKVVLICWHHGKIPDLTRALGGTPPQASWPGSVFDRVWSFTVPPAGGSGAPVENIPQMLLFGDSIS